MPLKLSKKSFKVGQRVTNARGSIWGTITKIIDGKKPNIPIRKSLRYICHVLWDEGKEESIKQNALFREGESSMLGKILKDPKSKE